MAAIKRDAEFTSSGFFALRTPLLPFDELLAWSDGLETAQNRDESGQVDAAMAADTHRLRERLRLAFDRPEVRDALFVASPDLDERFHVWRRDPESEAGQKLERALVRYFVRIAGRPTPFGLFAGCSVGVIGTESHLRLARRAEYRRHTRLDMDYLVQLTDALAREPEQRPALTLEVNSSLYPAQGRFRYREVRRNGVGWSHHDVALEGSDCLKTVLARARGGASPPEIAAALFELDPEATTQDTDEYISELVDNQVLISDLRPAVTGPEPIGDLVNRLSCRGTNSAAERVEAARRDLAAIDAAGIGVEPARYRHIAESLKALPGEVNLGRLFQVDMVKPMAAASLSQSVVGELLRGATILQRMARPPREDPLARFRDAFTQRYEGRAVPLIEALDAEMGVGFDSRIGGDTDASSLLDNLTLPQPSADTVPWGRRENTLLRKLSEAVASHSNEMVLTAHDLDELAGTNPTPLPDAFSVMAVLAAESEAWVDRGDFQILFGGLSGPSGARLLGRFCHADPELQLRVEEHIRAEEALQPDAIFAEIVHLPEGRLGNILARPILRQYEIPYLGRAVAPADRQIPVTDLLVAVIGDEIILYSKRLGRRVIPRLTSAHNFHRSRGIYRFLCALQSQGTTSDLAWDWGPLRNSPFLPRVVIGRLVFARARWTAGREELQALVQSRGADRVRATHAWRLARRLPRWIALADGDNELPIDLENVLALDTLIELVKERDTVTLTELFPEFNQHVVRGPEGRFVHELVVPFVRKPSAATSEAGRTRNDRLTARLNSRKTQRSFPPGSEWLYAKLYTGPATADEVLQLVVRPVIESALSSGAADGWFFIRYGDPDWHLRVRLHGRAERLVHEVLPALQTQAGPLLSDGRLWRIQLDTYEREVERYGGPDGIRLTERLFQTDSEAALALTDLESGDARGELRWRLAILGMDRLLIDFGFDHDARRAIVRATRGRFANEFHVDAGVQRQLGEKFRSERRLLENLLAESIESDEPFAAGQEILARRSQRWASAIAELRDCAGAGRLSVPLEELAPSFLHMHANRVLRLAHRVQELVLYDFLMRIYNSRLARPPQGRYENVANAIT